MDFNDLGLSAKTLAGVVEHGFERPTEVQEKVLPISLSGKDVMVQSKTGSGKTLVFLLTIFERYLKDNSSKALIVAPTRELAVQIEEDAISFSKGIEGYQIGCFYGGVGYSKQLEEVKEGVNLAVGTPGRLLDFLLSGKLDFKAFDIVVLDEADRMFDMGFYPDIEKMFSRMRAREERQTMLFSATLSMKVRNLAWTFMNEPEEIEVRPEEVTVKEITQELFHITKDEKFPLLLSLLKKINPQSAIIFTNTKDGAVEVAMRLKLNGYRASYLMGDMQQSKRLKTLDAFKDGRITILVATDVAARGLQIDDLELVVNYDIPEDYENYVHRIGRTARAGKSGKAVTLADETYIYGLEPIEEFIHMKIPVLWPDECGLEEVEDKSSGIKIKKAKAESRKAERPSRDRSKRSQGTRKSAPKNRKSSPDRTKKAHKATGKELLKKEVEGKNVKRINLNSIPQTEEKKGFFSFIKRIFGK